MLPGPLQTFQIQSFATIVNGLKQSPFAAKLSFLDVCVFLLYVSEIWLNKYDMMMANSGIDAIIELYDIIFDFPVLPKFICKFQF